MAQVELGGQDGTGDQQDHGEALGSYRPEYVFPLVDGQRSAVVIEDGSVQDFVSGFYAVSDDPGGTEEWLGYFAGSDADDENREDEGDGHDEGALPVAGSAAARVALGDRQVVGLAEIRALRGSMWEEVRRRRHRLDKVEITAVHDGGARIEYTIYGTVLLTPRDAAAEASPQETRWHGFAEIERRRRDGRGPAWRYKSYKVVLLP
ncbi:hypothetical protein Micbo1qcDRAFT_8872 [Microdochium bolleyi]|uniref:SnoaL-like domain-containing protein n=1 Tax=Microdochium bolleyi TaxID=196109 RepID=A0A136JKC7_9PEZI|nr:hypothetical protein Micbo1qcDRAFT_8872 [Microdochium bolleyi]